MDRLRVVNRIALLVALALLVTLGVAWWRERTRVYAEPRWEPARFAAVVPESAAAGRERWVVAVNLRCPHCQLHLRALADSLAGWSRRPALAALVVDQPEPPAVTRLGHRLDGGVWWDRQEVWRREWGRRGYGETYRFDADGRLVAATPAGVFPRDVPRE
jgi:hypothetical protein